MGVSQVEMAAKEICDVLGLKHCSKLDIRFEVGGLATVDARFIPEIDGVKQFPAILKKFKLIPIEECKKKISDEREPE